MLVLFTDFGLQGPYVGLLKLSLHRYAPSVSVIDLWHDAPAFDPQAGAYLLATYAQEFPQGTVFVGVVDPGVGGSRAGLILEADERFYIGPDNGLFDRIAARAEAYRAWRIIWRSSRLSATFHGRDLFAPVAAMLAEGTATPDLLGDEITFTPRQWPDDLARIVYIDHYGNAMTGIRATSMGNATLRVQEQTLVRAHTFSEVPVGEGFWYENSSALVEIAVNQGMASVHFGLEVGTPIEVIGDAITQIRSR